MGSIAGRKLIGKDGAPIGMIIDGMMRCSDRSLAYVVVSQGGIGGVGEQLHALDPGELRFRDDEVSCALDSAALQARRVIEPGAWPESIDRAA